MAKRTRYISVMVLVLMAVMALFGCSAQGETAENDPSTPGYKIALEANTPMERAVKANYPEAQIVYVNSATEGLLAVKTGKTDAYCGDTSSVETAISGGFDGVKMGNELTGAAEYAAVCISRSSHIENAKELVDALITQIKTDGTYDDMYRRWVVEGNYEMPDIPVPENPDKKIVVATSALYLYTKQSVYWT